MYKKFLSNRSYENKRTIREAEKSLKWKLRKYEIKAMDELAKEFGNTARRRNGKIFYC